MHPLKLPKLEKEPKVKPLNSKKARKLAGIGGQLVQYTVQSVIYIINSTHGKCVPSPCI